MGKTHDDEVYKDGVREGQRGGFLEDLVEGNISHTSKDEKIHQKGYVYGAQHRYGKQGRYHSYDGSGSNDSKDSLSKLKSFKSSQGTSESIDRDFGGSSESYSYDREYDKVYEAPLSTGTKWFLGLVVVTILGAISYPFVNYVIKLHFPKSEACLTVTEQLETPSS